MKYKKYYYIEQEFSKRCLIRNDKCVIIGSTVCTQCGNCMGFDCDCNNHWIKCTELKQALGE